MLLFKWKFNTCLFLTLRRTVQSRTFHDQCPEGKMHKGQKQVLGLLWPIKNKAASFPPKARWSLVHCVCQKSPDAPQNLCRCLHKHTLINDYWSAGRESWRTRWAQGTGEDQTRSAGFEMKERWRKWKFLTMSQSFWTRPGRKAQIRWQKLLSSPSPKVLQCFPV